MAALVVLLAAAKLSIPQAPARPPASLAMRAPEATAPAPAAPAPASVDRFAALPVEVDDLSDRVIFHFQLGQELTQGQLTQRSQASGEIIPLDSRDTRSFTFGQLSVGSNGMVVPELATYLAAHFRFDQDGALASSASLPTAFDASSDGGALLVRSAFAELDGLSGWARPLRVRAGRQFRYGMSVVHFDGISASWDGQRFHVAGFLGQRVSLYNLELLLGGENGLSPERPPAATSAMAGGEAELRLLSATGRPVVLGVEFLGVDGELYGQGKLRWEYRPELSLSAFARHNPAGLARFGAGMFARLSPTTTVSVDAEQRLADDWAYDLLVTGRAADGFSRFLYLGPRGGELYLSGRAGTVFLDNLDVLVSVAGATPTDEESPWQVPWAEAAAGIDAAVRANLQVALGGRIRQYLRPALSSEDDLDQFNEVTATGEKGIYDGTLRMRYSTGRKRFAAEFGLLLRYTATMHLERPRLSRLPLERYDVLDADSGVRLLVEAWLGERIRLLGDYEVTSAPKRFQEIRGLQVLRVIAEVSF